MPGGCLPYQWQWSWPHTRWFAAIGDWSHPCSWLMSYKVVLTPLTSAILSDDWQFQWQTVVDNCHYVIIFCSRFQFSLNRWCFTFRLKEWMKFQVNEFQVSEIPGERIDRSMEAVTSAEEVQVLATSLCRSSSQCKRWWGVTANS